MLRNIRTIKQIKKQRRMELLDELIFDFVVTAATIMLLIWIFGKGFVR